MFLLQASLYCFVYFSDAPTVTGGNGFFDNPDIPIAVITLCVLIFLIAVGFGIAKLVDYCHDRQAIRDDASDVSEYTRELLRAQLFLAFTNKARRKRKRGKETPNEIALRMGLEWKARAMAHRARRLRELKEKKLRKEQERANEGKTGTLRPAADKNTTPRPKSGVGTSNAQSNHVPGGGSQTKNTTIKSAKSGRPVSARPMTASMGKGLKGTTSSKSNAGGSRATSASQRGRTVSRNSSETGRSSRFSEVTTYSNRSPSPGKMSSVEYPEPSAKVTEVNETVSGRSGRSGTKNTATAKEKAASNAAKTSSSNSEGLAKSKAGSESTGSSKATSPTGKTPSTSNRPTTAQRAAAGTSRPQTATRTASTSPSNRPTTATHNADGLKNPARPTTAGRSASVGRNTTAQNSDKAKETKTTSDKQPQITKPSTKR